VRLSLSADDVQQVLHAHRAVRAHIERPHERLGRMHHAAHSLDGVGHEAVRAQLLAVTPDCDHDWFGVGDLQLPEDVQVNSHPPFLYIETLRHKKVALAARLTSASAHEGLMLKRAGRGVRLHLLAHHSSSSRWACSVRTGIDA